MIPTGFEHLAAIGLAFIIAALVANLATKPRR